MILHVCILFCRCIIEISDDETTEKSSNKGFVKHNLEWTPGTLKQSGTSPVLGKVQWYVD